MSKEQKPHDFLIGEDALNLWQQGKEAWNDWVKNHPNADVSFDGQTFYPSGSPAGGKIRFDGYKFPNGNVSFQRTNFGSSRVSFVETDFGDGDVSFIKLHIQGDIIFSNAKFGEGDKTFFDVQFEGYNAHFDSVEFGRGKVKFSRVDFVNCNVNFMHSKFAGVDLLFSRNTLSGRYLIFSEASFGNGSVSFFNCTFDGPLHFDNLQSVENLRTMSFEGCAINKIFSLSADMQFGCPLDLRRTKIAHQMVLNDIHCEFRKVWKWGRILPYLAEDKIDSQRFRRLKELALSNRNYAKALEFYVSEIQCRRGHESRWWQDIAQFLFWALADYGRSIFRPIIAMIASLILFAVIFLDQRQVFRSGSEENIATAITYSAGQMFAFLPVGRTARSQGELYLFGDHTPNLVIAVGALESMISIVLLFLLGMGLRNLFRM